MQDVRQDRRMPVQTKVDLVTGKDEKGHFDEQVTTSRVYITAQTIDQLIINNDRQIVNVIDNITKLQGLQATLEAQQARYQEIKAEFEATGKITGQIETPIA